MRRPAGRPACDDQARTDPAYSTGTKHEVANFGWEPVVYVCSFSASMRGTLFEDPTAPGVRPLVGRSASQPW